MVHTRGETDAFRSTTLSGVALAANTAAKQLTHASSTRLLGTERRQGGVSHSAARAGEREWGGRGLGLQAWADGRGQVNAEQRRVGSQGLAQGVHVLGLEMMCIRSTP